MLTWIRLEKRQLIIEDGWEHIQIKKPDSDIATEIRQN